MGNALQCRGRLSYHHRPRAQPAADHRAVAKADHPVWITFSRLGYIRPTRAGNLVLGSAGARNDQYSHHVDYQVAAIQAERWCQALPWLKDLAIVRGFAGITEYTPDGEPYIGACGAPGLFVAAGFHAEGFCPGPLVGKIIAELINGGESQVSLEAFRPERFADQLSQSRPLPPIVYPLDKMLGGATSSKRSW